MRAFTEHPASVGESYVEHFRSATGFGLRMVAAGIACLIHGLLPFLFQTVGSRTVTTLHDRMVRNRHRRPASVTPGDAGLAPGEGI